MAAPKFSPVAPTSRARAYRSPDHVPDNWMPDRPAEISGFQPQGERRGNPGPDQGFALRIARQLAPSLRMQKGEHVEDAIRGCLGVALRRASLFSRAPVVHDLNMAFTMWGFLDETPPTDLIEFRRPLFEGLRHVGHHYAEARFVADIVPEATLRLAPAEIDASQWRDLLGV